MCVFALFIMAFVYRLTFAMFLRIYLNKFSSLFFYFSPSNSEALLVCAYFCMLFFGTCIHQPKWFAGVCIFSFVFLSSFLSATVLPPIHPSIHLLNGAFVLFSFYSSLACVYFSSIIHFYSWEIYIHIYTYEKEEEEEHKQIRKNYFNSKQLHGKCVNNEKQRTRWKRE